MNGLVSQRNKMKEKAQNTCNALVAATDIPYHSHPLPYFIRYTVPLPKETTVARTMRKKLHHGQNNHEEEAKGEGEDMDVAKDNEIEIKKRSKGTGVFRKRFSSIFSNVLGGSFLYKSKTGKDRHQGQGREQGKGFVEESNGSDLPFVFSDPASKPGQKYGRKHPKHECKDDYQGVENMIPIKRLDNPLQEMHHSFLGFFDEKKRWKFIKEKMNRVNEKYCNTSVRSHTKVGNASTAIRVASSFRLVGKQECSRGRDKIRSRIVISRRKLKIARSSHKKMNKQGSKEEDEGDASSETPKSYNDTELCRKRILMGGRCKPLNSSGTLMYDKNGCLIPDLM